MALKISRVKKIISLLFFCVTYFDVGQKKCGNHQARFSVLVNERKEVSSVSSDSQTFLSQRKKKENEKMNLVLICFVVFSPFIVPDACTFTQHTVSIFIYDNFRL